MSVRSEHSIKRWIGLSTDHKPSPNVKDLDGITPTDADVTPGSTFFESDTGKIFRWTGKEWAYPTKADEEESTTLAAVVQALDDLRQEIITLRLGMIESETCSALVDEDEVLETML